MSPRALSLSFAPVLWLGACRQDMHDQPKFEPYEATAFFPDGRSQRPDVEGTVARGELRSDSHYYAGLVGGEPATTFPFTLTRADLIRGEERFDIYCAPCHDGAGTGTGMVVERGFPRPPSLHEPRLRGAPPGHFVDVMIRGFGRMYPYGDRIDARDRWRIAGHIRVLQRSQDATAADLPDQERHGARP